MLYCQTTFHQVQNGVINHSSLQTLVIIHNIPINAFLFPPPINHSSSTLSCSSNQCFTNSVYFQFNSITAVSADLFYVLECSFRHCLLHLSFSTKQHTRVGTKAPILSILIIDFPRISRSSYLECMPENISLSGLQHQSVPA